MANHQTEQRALKVVVAHEAANQRTAIRVHKCGYDLCSKGGNEERHIEVKGTAKKSFSFRWLEPKEQECLEQDPFFWLYLVTEADSVQPKIKKFNKADLEQRFHCEVTHHYYKFAKSEFI